MEEQQLFVHHLDLGAQQGQLRLDSGTLLEGLRLSPGTDQGIWSLL